VIAVVAIGSFTMIAACLGCAGAQLENHSLICTYFMFVVVLAMWYLITLITTLNFNAISVRIVDRQATQFCNVSQFYTFKAELGCTFPATREGSLCGADCQDRVNLLRSMDGCNLLNVMCHRFAWMPVGPGFCLSASQLGGLGRPPTYTNNAALTPIADEAACQEVCNQHVACAGVSYGVLQKNCYLVMKLAPTYGNWSKVKFSPPSSTTPEIENAYPVTGSGGEVGYACTKKDQPIIVTEADSFTRMMAWFFGVAILLSCAAMCCTCSLLYTTSTRRKGKKGACPLMHKLLCPCCLGSEKRKFSDGSFDVLDDEEDAD